jgi:hypothetical protein
MLTQSNKRGRKPGPIQHGTLWAYRHYKCRCRTCTDVQTERCKEWIQTRDLANAPHGTASGYQNWRCRCDPCKVAGAIQNKLTREAMIARGWVPKERRK